MINSRVVSNTGKSIAIAVAILGRKTIAIMIAIVFAKTIAIMIAIVFAILHYLLPQNFLIFDAVHNFFLNFGLTTDFMIMWSTQNLNKKQVVLTCFSCSVFFTRSNKTNENLFS